MREGVRPPAGTVDRGMRPLQGRPSLGASTISDYKQTDTVSRVDALQDRTGAGASPQRRQLFFYDRYLPY